MSAVPRHHLHRTALRRTLAALLTIIAVIVLSAGAGTGTDTSRSAGAGGPSGTQTGPGSLSAGASGLSGASGEAEGTPDSSTDAELRLQPGQVRRTPAPPARPRHRPAAFAASRPDCTPPAVPARSAPARGSAPHPAHCAVLRC